MGAATVPTRSTEAPRLSLNMRPKRQFAGSKKQAGSALLIAIFSLLLISVVGIALIISTGTDSALAGNYRSSTSAYYAAVAGLEEARGRLLGRNPDYINKSSAYSSLFSGQGTTFGATDVLYIVNPAGGETVDPTNSSSRYADNEYQSDLGWALSGANVYTPYVTSVSPMAGMPGPMYKWVRINAVTEQALKLDVDSDGDQNPTAVLYYGGNGLTPTAGAGPQALELTSFAIMPDGSSKILQYVVAPSPLNLAFPAALTLAGNGVSYAGPSSSGFYGDGIDPTSGRSCTTPPWATVFALGVTNSADQTNVTNAAKNYHPENYTGTGFVPAPPPPATPSVGLVTLPPTLQTPSQWEALVQTIIQSADVILTANPPAVPVPGSALPTGSSGMSATNPMTVVVKGDLDLTAWHNTGYGLLLVTGRLIYDPDASWEGVVLVIGKGTVTGSHMGNGHFDGAMIVAQSRDASGNVLPDPTLGASSVTFDATMGGSGLYFNSCTIQQALAPTKYLILSFREIPR